MFFVFIDIKYQEIDMPSIVHEHAAIISRHKYFYAHCLLCLFSVICFYKVLPAARTHQPQLNKYRNA